jgi:PPOX class probable F420-dependent enzyme
MTRAEALARTATARVGRIATVRPDGTPHVVPLVFALVVNGRDVRLYWAVDRKPKRSTALTRIANIRANPVCEVVVDGYDEDWTRLWWVRLGGPGRVVEDGDERRTALAALAAKYPAYGAAPPEGDVVAMQVTDVRWWSAVDA